VQMLGVHSGRMGVAWDDITSAYFPLLENPTLDDLDNRSVVV
jgi:hypothetical protein